MTKPISFEVSQRSSSSLTPSSSFGQVSSQVVYAEAFSERRKDRQLEAFLHQRFGAGETVEYSTREKGLRGFVNRLADAYCHGKTVVVQAHGDDGQMLFTDNLGRTRRAPTHIYVDAQLEAMYAQGKKPKELVIMSCEGASEIPPETFAQLSQKYPDTKIIVSPTVNAADNRGGVYGDFYAFQNGQMSRSKLFNPSEEIDAEFSAQDRDYMAYKYAYADYNAGRRSRKSRPSEDRPVDLDFDAYREAVAAAQRREAERQAADLARFEAEVAALVHALRQAGWIVEVRVVEA